ncbi:MAG: hypothetical protein GTN81_06875 [Proteobacteria bacterium]|nr:hypothetical protein [Pseudomonadota bacterium]
MKKKGKKKKTEKALPPETASLVKALVQEIKEEEKSGEPLEASLQKIQSQLGESSDRAVAIVDALGSIPTERTANLLHALSRSVSDKPVLRGIKRSLYRIEQRGITIGPVERDRDEPAILRPPVEERPRGFVSAVDSEGSQIVFLTVSRRPKGLYLLQGIVSDTRGLIEFNRLETTKRGFRDFLQSTKKPGQLPIVDSDVGYCRFLLEEAARLTEEQGSSLPTAYRSSKRDLEKMERVDRHPVFLMIDEKEIEGDTRSLKNSGDLFQIELFSSWVLPAEDVQEYVNLVKEAGESRLVLNPAQKEQRLQETYRKALIEVFTEERRLRYKKRLEEMAYILIKEGDEDRARAALAAGIDLRSEVKALDLDPNPFLLNLVIRSIYAIVARDAEKKDAEPSVIVKP